MNALGMWEGRLLLWIQENMRFGWLDGPMRIITSMGNDGIFWIALIIALLLFKKTRKTALCCALSMALTLLVVNIGLKPMFARTRPYVLMENLSILVGRPGDFSFPSGHSAHALACSWVIWRMHRNKWGAGILALGILIALSRLYVGVHFPSDVICGIGIGMGMACIAMWIFSKFKFRAKA